jgi:hypothetical protein
MSFDRMPNDSMIVCLLGEGDAARAWSNLPVRGVETPETLTVGPRLLPLKFTEVSRYYRSGRRWRWTQQTGVLTRGEAGAVELHPVIREDDWRPPEPHWADRLADLFRVPVRRVELDRAESEALGDC